MEKRVIIIDTSNEIAGDSDIPHFGIGRARRMQVSQTNLQHHVMIEAVENHMPEIIIIDEIGTELEATAARTIAERGVQLIGTAHGNALENLWTIHENVQDSIDSLLRGSFSITQTRQFSRDEKTRLKYVNNQASILKNSQNGQKSVLSSQKNWISINNEKSICSTRLRQKKLVLYSYSISYNLIKEVISKLKVDISLTKEWIKNN